MFANISQMFHKFTQNVLKKRFKYLMKIKLSTRRQSEPVVAIYHYDETTPLKKKSPKSKGKTCQICFGAKIKTSKELDECNFDAKDTLNSIKCQKCSQSICVSCFKRNLHPILCIDKECNICPSNVSYEARGTGFMHTCPFCRFKTGLSPLALGCLLFGSEMSNKFLNDPDRLDFWCNSFE